jgi:putative protein-disulfide isomerase
MVVPSSEGSLPGRISLEASAFTFLIDPLCGWCYAATPQLAALREQVGKARVDLLPTGLFAGAGVRPMTAGFRDYAWSQDQRIAQMTGQPFSQVYYDHVLSNEAIALDSGPASLLLAIADILEPGCGLDLLIALQHARFVEGLDLTDREVLVAVAGAAGFAPATIDAAFSDARQLERAVDRITTGRRHLSRHGLEGVPALIQQQGDSVRIIANTYLLGPLPDLIAQCRRNFAAE